MDTSAEQVRDHFRKMQEECMENILADLDRKAVIMVTGCRYKHADLILRIASATGQSVQTVQMALDELRHNVNRLEKEIAAIDAHALKVHMNEFSVRQQEDPIGIGWNPNYIPPSRRGRNIKPDTSRRARYTTPKSHE